MHCGTVCVCGESAGVCVCVGGCVRKVLSESLISSFKHNRSNHLCNVSLNSRCKPVILFAPISIILIQLVFTHFLTFHVLTFLAPPRC